MILRSYFISHNNTQKISKIIQFTKWILLNSIDKRQVKGLKRLRDKLRVI